MKLIVGAHTWTIQAAAGLSSVLAQRQEQVTCGCGGWEKTLLPDRNDSCSALPQHEVSGARANEARTKM